MRICRFLILAVVLASTVILCNGCSYTIGSFGIGNAHHKTVLTASGPFPAGGTFEAESANGSITVTGRDTTTCQVTAKISAQAKTPEEARKLADALQLEVTSSGDRTTPTIRTPKLRDGQSISVGYDVTLPKGSNVKLKSMNGSLSMSGVSGSLEGETMNGSIDVQQAWGRCKLVSHNGAVTVVYVSDAPADCQAEIEAMNGGIDITLPTNCSAQVDASSMNGEVTSDRPITMSGKISGGALHGTIGTGTGKLSLKSHNGSVTIR